MGSMRLKPITLKAANEFVKEHHRHSKPTIGHKYSIGVVDDIEGIIGVAIVGRPVGRGYDDGYTAEVLRVCTAPSAEKNICSMLYAGAWRSWKGMGGDRIITYTLEREKGISVQSAGWLKGPTIQPKSKPWKGPDRDRVEQKVFLEPKIRWEINTRANSV